MESENKRTNAPRTTVLSRIRLAALATDFSLTSLMGAAVMAVLAALGSGASLLGTYPFAFAVIGAASDFASLAAALAGAVLGLIPQAHFLPHATAAVFLAAARLICARLLVSAPEDCRGFRRILAVAGRESIWVRAALGATSAMLAGALAALLGAEVRLLSAALLAILVPVLTLAVTTVTVPEIARTSARDGGVLVLLFSVVRALRDMTGLPISLGAVVAFAVPVLAACGTQGKNGTPLLPDSRRIMSGAMGGLVCGLAMDPGGAPLYAAAAMTAGLLARLSPSVAILGGWGTALGISLCGGGWLALSAVLPEITVTAAVLVPLLRYGNIRMPALTRAATPTDAAEISLARTAASDSIARMRTQSAALSRIATMLTTLSARLGRPSLSEMKDVCRRTVEAYCADCENRALCHDRECATMSDTLGRMASEAHRTGRVSAAVIPAHLAARCHRMESILDAVAEHCALREEQARSRDHSGALAEDFASVSTLLAETAESSEAEFRVDPALSERLSRSLRAMDFYAGHVTVYGVRRRRILATELDLSRVRLGSEDIRHAAERVLACPLAAPEYALDGETVSMLLTSVPRFRTAEGMASRAAGEADGVRHAPNGDCAVSFSSEDGRYYMLITDGMGTGSEASLSARTAARFLEEALGGGMGMQTALTMLNRYLGARQMECSTGIDLMELDLYTGEARFVKSGAAPSFVVREGRLFRLASKTVPIGILRALDAEMIRFAPEAGDIIVMLSDGVTESFEDAAWLYDMLASTSVMQLSPAEIAEKIIAAATAVTPRRDDITAAVVKIA